MLENAVKLYTESDFFAAVEFLNQQGDKAETANTYSKLVLHCYNELKDAVGMELFGLAGIQYALNAAAVADGEEAAKFKGVAAAISYNLSANLWPGWGDEGIVLSASQSVVGLNAAKTNLRLVQELNKGDLAESRSNWAIGSHLLALGKLDEAIVAFDKGANHAEIDGEEGDKLLNQAYSAMTAVLKSPDDAKAEEKLASLKEQMKSLEHGDFFIGQVDTAHKIFSK